MPEDVEKCNPWPSFWKPMLPIFITNDYVCITASSAVSRPAGKNKHKKVHCTCGGSALEDEDDPQQKIHLVYNAVVRKHSQDPVQEFVVTIQSMTSAHILGRIAKNR